MFISSKRWISNNTKKTDNYYEEGEEKEELLKSKRGRKGRDRKIRMLPEISWGFRDFHEVKKKKQTNEKKNNNF